MGKKTRAKNSALQRAIQAVAMNNARRDAARVAGRFPGRADLSELASRFGHVLRKIAQTEAESIKLVAGFAAFQGYGCCQLGSYSSTTAVFEASCS